MFQGEVTLNRLAVKIEPTIVDRLKSFRQGAGKAESGGILLGTVYTDKVVISGLTTPNSLDKAGQFYFKRNVKRAQLAVDKAWHMSGGTCIYLGEWHTHPQEHPVPSADDFKLLVDMLTTTRMQIDFLLMIIVGRSENCLIYKDMQEQRIWYF